MTGLDDVVMASLPVFDDVTFLGVSCLFRIYNFPSPKRIFMAVLSDYSVTSGLEKGRKLLGL